MDNTCTTPELGSELFVDTLPSAPAIRTVRARVLAAFRSRGAVAPEIAQQRTNAYFGVARSI